MGAESYVNSCPCCFSFNTVLIGRDATSTAPIPQAYQAYCRACSETFMPQTGDGYDGLEEMMMEMFFAQRSGSQQTMREPHVVSFGGGMLVML